MSLSTTVEHPTRADGGALGAFGGALKRLLAAYIAWRVEQAALAILRSMSDRELKDIGLGRSEIMFAVRSEATAERVLTREW